MKHIKYRNTDKKAIKILMKEIGAYRYEKHLWTDEGGTTTPEHERILFGKNDDCIFLCHRYRSGYVLKLMKAEQFQMLPGDGWKLIKQ